MQWRARVVSIQVPQYPISKLIRNCIDDGMTNPMSTYVGKKYVVPCCIGSVNIWGTGRMDCSKGLDSSSNVEGFTRIYPGSNLCGVGGIYCIYQLQEGLWYAMSL